MVKTPKWHGGNSQTEVVLEIVAKCEGMCTIDIASQAGLTRLQAYTALIRCESYGMLRKVSDGRVACWYLVSGHQRPLPGIGKRLRELCEPRGLVSIKMLLKEAGVEVRDYGVLDKLDGPDRPRNAVRRSCIAPAVRRLAENCRRRASALDRVADKLEGIPEESRLDNKVTDND